MSRHRDDGGSVLVLVLGVVLVLSMLVAVVVDAGRSYLSRRALDSVTDGAALAGAQAVDLGAVYSGRAGPGTDLALDDRAVAAAVRGYLARSESAGRLRGFALTAVEIDGAEVTVRASATVRLPFVGPFTSGTSQVVVRTSSTASNHVVAP